MKTVYLAGPITGCSYGGCANWRETAIQQLRTRGANPVQGLCPMRAKEYLAKEEKISGSYEWSAMSSARGITTRDRFDCTRCDVILVNLLGATKVSIGTVLEIAWADANRIPIILVMEKAGNPHEHPMISELAGFRVTTLDEAIDIAIAILG